MNERTIKANLDLLEVYSTYVKKYPHLFLKSVPLHRVILNDCARWWKNYLEPPCDYKIAKVDGKAMKSMLLTLRRLRYRADRQRDLEVSQLAATLMNKEYCVDFQRFLLTE